MQAARLGFQKLSNILPSDRNLNKDMAKQPVIDVDTIGTLSFAQSCIFGAEN
jgi:hypothetical protein